MLFIILNCPLETFSLMLELFWSISEFQSSQFIAKLGDLVARMGNKLTCPMRPLIGTI